MQKYGTGSDFQRAALVATAAIQALAGGDTQKAIASGASPYLAQLVKDVTLPKDESKITASDIATNAMAHAVVGAVVAQLSGQDAAAGAIGASSGELAARAIMALQYPGKTANDLTEAEKQSVSALSTLAAGLVSGLAGNSTASAASGAQSGRNAVENNLFGKVLVEGCAIAAPCRTKIAEQLLEIGVKAGITAVVAKEIADKLSTEELEHLITLKMMGNDEITVRYLSSLQDKYLPSHTGGDQIVGQLPNNTGNTEGAPDLPNHYESGNKITQGEHATIRNKEGRPVGSVINDVQNSRPSDILVQDDGRWVVLGPKGRVHIIEPSGEVVTSMQNPKQNTNNRLQDGRWEKLNSDKLQEFKDKFSDYVRW
ncbi:VENN motif pre-toxin domain-containing protein [Pectobacterium aroidearum]|uniref:VENN motif pre-toxin domain-containing protein n=1 Tax=Pectobacterium aroidearum TaxID=1201031 RepID=UPI0015F11A4D|nr:VENN motif pre-toxin domain-containing protein [Pectobacterium aroidearum]MBA5235552.1 VENN motif pre-toxin domain-containing protein [Pectobacterium aroidearum]